MKKILSIVLASTVVLSMVGCSSTKGQTGGKAEQVQKTGTSDGKGGVWDPYTPYKETVTFSKVGPSDSSGYGWPEGDSMINNPYTRHVKDMVNVGVTIKYETDANNAKQKLSLAIASKDIPDVMAVDRNTFRQLIDNDLIADMTEAYDKCMAPWIKEQYKEYGDTLLKHVTVDGKLMGIPGTNIANDHPLLWIRKDWLDKLNLQVPKTMDDIAAVAKAFIEKDPGGNGAGKTIGFSIALPTSGTIYGTYGAENSINTMFSTFGAYPGNWINKDGKAVWGSIQPENKAALAKFAQLYKDGILDKEFAVRKAADREALISSGKLGMGTAKQYGLSGTADSVINNPKAEWVVESAPVDAQGKLKVAEGDPITHIMVVRKGYEHPEAIVKAMNAGYEMLRNKGEKGKAAFEKMLKESPGLSWSAMPVPVNMSPKNYIGDIHNDILQALKKNDREAMQLKEFRDIYDLVKKDMDNPKKDKTAWSKRMQRIEGGAAAIAENQVDIPVAFYGTTDTMATKWAALTKLETDTYLKIIMGEKPVDEFDKFVQQWLAMGGQEITNEVNKLKK